MGESLASVERNLVQAEGYLVGARSGLMTGIAAGADVFGLRNILSTKDAIAISWIRLRWVTTTAFATAQSLAFRVNKVYGFTAIHTTGGTAVQAHYRRQSQRRGTASGDRVLLTEISSYISGTVAITGATYTAEDTDELECYGVGAGSTLPGVYEDWTPEDGIPLVLEADEGLVINNEILMGATGEGRLAVIVGCYRVQ
jgi:hypothetical protein